MTSAGTIERGAIAGQDTGGPMRFEGSVPIKADRATVWAFVNDPTKVAACGPGVEGVQVIDDRHFKVTARVGVGIIRATFVVD
ncbi:MAG: hypothetical protein KJ041_10305, partial [Gammaproteobacteria bacterium]|nr:hypothetical protein [Gammaproteobacteria bacterium]